MTEQTWADYRTEVFGDPFTVWHDGADFGEVGRRFATDPGTTAAMLTAGLAEGDALAAEAVRELVLDDGQRSAFVQLLSHVVATSSGSTTNQCAASLFALTGSAEWAVPLTGVLASPDTWGNRMDAARLLRRFAPTPALVVALSGGVRDLDHLVRFHSANTLLAWAGISGDISSDATLFPLLLDEAGADGWAQAADLLAAKVQV